MLNVDDLPLANTAALRAMRRGQSKAFRVSESKTYAETLRTIWTRGGGKFSLKKYEQCISADPLTFKTWVIITCNKPMTKKA